MLSIDASNTITLTRGDSAYLQINLASKNSAGESETYTMDENDILRLTVRKNITSEIVLQKEIAGSPSFHLLPSDTTDMDFGDYVYDVELTQASGDVYTVIDVSKLKIGKEVTY